jgi:hypothetical protein
MNIKKHSTKSTELTIPLKFELGTFVRLHVCSNRHGITRLGRFHITKINFQTQNSLLYCFDRQNEQCPEIAFSGHQNAENEHNETFKKKSTEMTTPLNFQFSMLHLCSNHQGKKRHC